MRRFIFTAIILTVFLINSCVPVATFDEPQPEGIKPLAKFPERLRGHYQDENGVSVLSIYDRLVIRHYDFHIREHRNDIGSSFLLSGDTLINTEEETKEIIIMDGDTVVSNVEWIDTLFSISNGNVLKKFRGYHFMNYLYRENAWTVEKLHLSKGVLTVGSVSSPEDIKNLRAITECVSDTASTHFSPSRKQFRQFVRQDGFRDEERFFRIGKSRK